MVTLATPTGFAAFLKGNMQRRDFKCVSFMSCQNDDFEVYVTICSTAIGYQHYFLGIGYNAEIFNMIS